ncbi:hypothetical protein L284_19000 [Novosphingobium lindaniclasticum LE124]|uniref:Uncharacterized protein n=1 Tax=Novosphingobium lindaniclasticum LE124 TaxID=1096930 RepID=T0H9K0_9SPHN|nr:hypothetical protein L284_19000 [Novosphingobium lindaniclasticum LE124]
MCAVILDRFKNGVLEPDLLGLMKGVAVQVQALVPDVVSANSLRERVEILEAAQTKIADVSALSELTTRLEHDSQIVRILTVGGETVARDVTIEGRPLHSQAEDGGLADFSGLRHTGAEAQFTTGRGAKQTLNNAFFGRADSSVETSVKTGSNVRLNGGQTTFNDRSGGGATGVTHVGGGVVISNGPNGPSVDFN